MAAGKFYYGLLVKLDLHLLNVCFCYRHSGGGSNGTPGNEKPFACPVPGCKKRYKNVNGIKYHSKNGHKKDGRLVDNVLPTEIEHTQNSFPIYHEPFPQSA